MDSKLGRYRKGVVAHRKSSDTVIVSKFGGTCRLCKERIPAGTWVKFSNGQIAHNFNCQGEA